MKTKFDYKSYHKAWRQRHKERLKPLVHKANLKQRERIRNDPILREHLNALRRQRRSDKTRVNEKRYYEKNKLKIFCKIKRRKLQIAAQCPLWANLEKIELIYSNCPKDSHVDHILPLRGKLVSGLHVETNLQYLTEKENLKKGNNYVVEV